ncbi:MAG: hypothetical protein K0S41_468 [Anaerocolumna sp.]|jgi:GH24 family phage-related lysozyme (muramidase)|nr:hypothetical protein [Anaerocolumna sp.]
MGLSLSSNGIKVLKQFEGCRLKAYKVVPTETYYTIGYGHYGADVMKGMIITQTQAEAYLKADLKTFEDAVNKNVKVNITQNQFDALVSFTYNCGPSALKSSTLLKKINSGNLIDASLEFAKWNKSGGKVLTGLVKRREAETVLFLAGYCEKPKGQVSNKTATKPEIRWIQWKIGESTDGIWGEKTANGIRTKRKSLGWEETSGFTCSNNLLKELAKL